MEQKEMKIKQSDSRGKYWKHKEMYPQNSKMKPK